MQMSSNRMKQKKQALDKVQAENPRFKEFTDHVVDPGAGRSILAPSLCPSRAGSVSFPLIVDVTGQSDVTIIAQPDISRPLMISHGSIPESGNTIGGFGEKDLGSAECVLTAEAECLLEPIELENKHGQSLFSAAGGSIQANVAVLSGDVSRYTISLDFFDSATNTWVFQGSVAKTVGTANSILGPFAYSATMTAFAFSMVPITGPRSGAASMVFNMVPTVGTFTCANGSVKNAFDVHVPEWSKILEVADKLSIPFMDCLVTYQGSTLNNQGAIAVAGTSEEISPGDDGTYYQSVASRPFDAYEGRLASQGDTEGGAHWHLIHDDIRAYSLTSASNLITGPRGYFAIKNMDPTQTVRIMVHLTLNYYTIDPAFNMTFQPAWGSTDLLLHVLRTQVPLVSSNDGHLEKLFRLAKRKAVQAGRWALKNPEEAAAMASSGLALMM